MTNSEIVKAYVALHKEPVQESIPEFYQKWSTPHGPEYWKSSNCERTRWQSNPYAIVKAPAHNWIETAYIHYIPQFKMLEFSVVAINNCGRHQDNDIYRWVYVKNRVFLIRDAAYLYNEKGQELWPAIRRSGCSAEFRAYLKELQRFFHDNLGNPQRKEMAQLCLCENFIGPMSLAYEYPAFMASRKRTDGLPEPEKDLRELMMEYLRKENMLKIYIACLEKRGGHASKSNSFTGAYFERINGDQAVIRFFRAEFAFDNISSMKVEETKRAYIAAGKVRIVVHKSDEWQEDQGQVSETEFINRQEFMECEEVAHVYEISSQLRGRDQLENILLLIQFPIIECLYKAGYTNLAYALSRCISSSTRENQFQKVFKDLFGKNLPKKGNLQQITGCNKWMLKVMESFDRGYNGFGAVLEIYRQQFGADFMHFSKEKIEKYLLAFVALSRCAKDKGMEWNVILTGHEDLQTEDKSTMERFVKIYNGGDHDIFDRLADIIRLHNALGLNYGEAVVATLRTSRNIYELHDHLTEQLNAQRHVIWIQNEEQKRAAYQKLFDQRQEGRRAQFNYEDDSYLIRVPESMDEITEEGRKLRHCVGSYVYQHAQGLTNILFLRKKDMPDAPYYTIEVRNNKVIQIHGFANKWLGNEPDAISFVYGWVKKLKIQCDKSILLCQSQGYCQTRVMLDESYLHHRVFPVMRFRSCEESGG